MPTGTTQDTRPTKRQATLSNATITLTADVDGTGGGGSGGGLTTDQKIAIGVGVPSAVGTVVAAIVAWKKVRRDK